MKITTISRENLAQHLNMLIALNDEFLAELGESPKRTVDEKQAILEHMIENAPSTVLLLVTGDDDRPIGISYYNFGTGYSCGGTYLWLNGIYIRPGEQKRGYGSRLLEHLEADALRRGATLFVCSRNLDNEASRRLFDRAGFMQQTHFGMKKDL